MCVCVTIDNVWWQSTNYYTYITLTKTIRRNMNYDWPAWQQQAEQMKWNEIDCILAIVPYN